MEIDESQIMVTGGAGFIGSHLTRHLLDRGATIDVVDDLFVGRPEYVPDRATLHELDLRSDRLHDVVRDVDPDAVFHLAALHHIPYCNDHPEAAFEVNVMGTRNLLEAATDLDGLEQIVYTSTAAVYPPGEDAHHETDHVAPTDIYGRSKLVGEDILELFHERTGVLAASARLFNVYGPNETNEHLIPAILEQIRDGSRSVDLGNLTPARDFVYVDDVAHALVHLLAAFETTDHGYRTYNVGTGTEHTVREVVAQVADALGEEITIEQDEDRVRKSDRPHLRAATERIEREIGWTPQTDFVDGLRQLLAAEEIESETEVSPGD